MLQGAFVPFAASAALFAGYLVVKFFPDLDVAKVLNGYFWFIGSIAVAGALRQPLRRAVSPCSCFLPYSMWQRTICRPLVLSSLHTLPDPCCNQPWAFCLPLATHCVGWACAASELLQSATFDGLHLQTGLLGDPSIQTTVPEGWFLDDSGASVTDVSWAPIDALTLLMGLAAATIDLRSGHTNFSLNNLLACLIATDILQVGLHCLL